MLRLPRVATAAGPVVFSRSVHCRTIVDVAAAACVFRWCASAAAPTTRQIAAALLAALGDGDGSWTPLRAVAQRLPDDVLDAVSEEFGGLRQYLEQAPAEDRSAFEMRTNAAAAATARRAERGINVDHAATEALTNEATWVLRWNPPTSGSSRVEGSASARGVRAVVRRAAGRRRARALR